MQPAVDISDSPASPDPEPADDLELYGEWGPGDTNSDDDMEEEPLPTTSTQVRPSLFHILLIILIELWYCSHQKLVQSGKEKKSLR